MYVVTVIIAVAAMALAFALGETKMSVIFVATLVGLLIGGHLSQFTAYLPGSPSGTSARTTCRRILVGLSVAGSLAWLAAMTLGVWTALGAIAGYNLTLFVCAWPRPWRPQPIDRPQQWDVY